MLEPGPRRAVLAAGAALAAPSIARARDREKRHDPDRDERDPIGRDRLAGHIAAQRGRDRGRADQRDGRLAGRRIELVVRDSKGQPQEAAQHKRPVRDRVRARRRAGRACGRVGGACAVVDGGMGFCFGTIGFPAFTDELIYIAMILVLVLRPTGLFGREVV